MLDQVASRNLRVYAVWLPVLRAGNVASAADREGGRISDPRALHFLDPDARLAREYSKVLHLPGRAQAWDVYLVFGPEARWGSEPPPPTYWMHQLGDAPPELRLEGEQLARVVSGLLNSTRKSAGQGVGHALAGANSKP